MEERMMDTIVEIYNHIAACYVRAVTVIYSHNEGESPTENKTHGGYRP